MNEEKRKLELDGLKKTLAAIEGSKKLNRDNKTIKDTIEQLRKMIKERTK
jgi:hypothetical protein